MRHAIITTALVLITALLCSGQTKTVVVKAPAEVREVKVVDTAAVDALTAENTKLRDELTAIKSAPVRPQLTKEQAARAPVTSARRVSVYSPQRRAILPWRR